MPILQENIIELSCNADIDWNGDICVNREDEELNDIIENVSEIYGIPRKVPVNELDKESKEIIAEAFENGMKMALIPNTNILWQSEINVYANGKPIDTANLTKEERHQIAKENILRNENNGQFETVDDIRVNAFYLTFDNPKDYYQYECELEVEVKSRLLGMNNDYTTIYFDYDATSGDTTVVGTEKDLYPFDPEINDMIRDSIGFYVMEKMQKFVGMTYENEVDL